MLIVVQETTINSFLLQNLITAGLILFPLMKQLCTHVFDETILIRRRTT